MSVIEWHEDDAFWHETESAVFTEERWQQAGTEVDQVLTLAKPPGGGAVLDLGCGVGRHALRFAQRGYRVTGVDRTAKYLERARTKANDNALDIEWVQADMRQFRRDAAFDLVVNLLTTFGYFKDPAEDQRVAQNVWASLKPGGKFVIELMGKEVLARIFRPTDWHREPDGTLVLEERKLTEDWSRLKARWIILKEDGPQAGSDSPGGVNLLDGSPSSESTPKAIPDVVGRYDREFELRLYGASDLKRLLEGVGFAQVDAYGSLDSKPYDHEANRLAVVARK